MFSVLTCSGKCVAVQRVPTGGAELVCFGFWLPSGGLWDLSSAARNQIRAPALGARNLNHWTPNEVLELSFLVMNMVAAIIFITSDFL